MPWKKTTPMTERLSFIGLYHTQLYSMTELCERFGISRKTGYKWLDRYVEEGLVRNAGKEPSPAPLPLAHIS